MRVSIIIPSYNQEKFVSEAIDSALRQIYFDKEIIVVDDASTDGSANLVENSFGSKVRLLRHKVNQGLVATRNDALSMATGDLILPLDADDRLLPNYLERTIPRMTDDVGVVSSWMIMIVTPKMQESGHRDQFTGYPGSGWPIHTPSKEEILTNNCLPTCSLIRHTVLKELGGWPKNFTRGSEDWALWAKITTMGKWRIEVVPEFLFIYRVHENSLSRSSIMAPQTEARKMVQEYCRG